MSSKVKVLFDWGGTVSKDAFLFKHYANNSGNNKITFDPEHMDSIFRPDYWENIKNIGNENFFSKAQEKIFDISEVYCDSIRTVNEFYATEGMSSSYENIIVYDNKPKLDLSQDKIQLLFAKAILEKGMKVNGIYIDTDKVSLAKKLGADYVVDDDPRIILALASANIKSILVSRLWNRAFSIDDVWNFVSAPKAKIIMKNVFIAEDFSDVERIIKNKKGDT